jgi:hypothetical protein
MVAQASGYGVLLLVLLLLVSGQGWSTSPIKVSANKAVYSCEHIRCY